MKRLMTTLLFVMLCGTGLCLADGVTVSGAVTFENPYSAGNIVDGSASGTVQLLNADGTVAHEGTIATSSETNYKSIYTIDNVAAGTYTLSFVGEGYGKLIVYTKTDLEVGTENLTHDFQATFDDTRGFMTITVKYGEWNEQYGYWANTTNIAGATVTCKSKAADAKAEVKQTDQSGAVKFLVAKDEEALYDITVKAEAYLDTAFEIKGMMERYGSVDFTSQEVYMREKPLPAVTLSGAVTLGGKAIEALAGETKIGIKTVKGKLLTSPVTNGQYTFSEVPVGATTFFIYDPDGGYDYTWGTTLSANYAVKTPADGQITLTANDAMEVAQDIDIEQIAVNVSGKITGMSGQASVYLMNGETRVNEVRSNYVGEYTFKGVKPGTYTISVSVYGYEQKNTPSVTVTLEADATAETITMEGKEMEVTFQNTYFQVYNQYVAQSVYLAGAKIELWNADGTEKVAETTAGDETAYAAFSLKTTARMGDQFLIKIKHPDIEDFEMSVTVEQQTISVYPSGITFKYDGPALLSVVNPRGEWNAGEEAVVLNWQWPEEWKNADTYEFYTIGLTRRLSSESGSGTYLTSWDGSLFKTEPWPEATYTDTAAENGNLYIYLFTIRYAKPYSGSLDSAFQVDLRPTYRIDWQANDATMGQVVSEYEPGDYPEGSYLTLVALPEEDMLFGGWFDGGEELSRKDTFSFAVERDLTLTAVFKKARLSVVVKAEPETAGTVSGGGEYLAGETVTVKAVANAGYKFVAWMDGETEVSRKAEYTFSPDKDLTLTAKFETVKYVLGLAVNDPQAGKVEGSGEYAAGTKVTVKALPNEGYRFVNWTADGKEVSGQAEYELTVTEDLLLTANFAKTGEYTLTLTVNNADWGQVTGGGTFAAGTGVTVRATPVEHHHFVAWLNGTDTVSREAVYSFTLEADLALTAHFAPGAANEMLAANTWSVYSQDGVLTINGADGSRYHVYDMTGRLAGQASGAEVRLSVDRNKLYVVRCLTADGRFGVKKIVVR